MFQQKTVFFGLKVSILISDGQTFGYQKYFYLIISNKYIIKASVGYTLSCVTHIRRLRCDIKKTLC